MDNVARQRLWITLGIVAGIGVVLYLLAPILMPFVLGAGLAYLGDPIADRLERLRISRTGAVVIVFLILFLVIVIALIFLVPMLQQQIALLLQKIPDWLRWLQTVGLPKLGFSPPQSSDDLRKLVGENWAQASDLARAILSRVTHSGGALLIFVANVVMLPVVTFYLLRDWDRLVLWIQEMVPRHALPRVNELARETDFVLGAFLRGQLTVMIALAIIYSFGLWLVGVDLGLLIGFGAGMISFVPYLGFIVGFFTAGIAVVVQTQEWLPLLWVGLVFWVGQIIEGGVLTPWLVGDRIGLHPVTVIFAVMAGGQLFGFLGILLALPVAAVLAVLARHAKEYWLGSLWYQSP